MCRSPAARLEYDPSLGTLVQQTFSADWKLMSVRLAMTRVYAATVVHFRLRTFRAGLPFQVIHTAFPPVVSLWLLCCLIDVYNLAGIEFSHKALWRRINCASITVIKTTTRSPFKVASPCQCMSVCLANRRITFLACLPLCNTQLISCNGSKIVWKDIE